MPNRPQIVIVDTTPIISLCLVQQLHLFQLLYGEVLIPPAVKAEVLAGRIRAGATELHTHCSATRSTARHLVE